MIFICASCFISQVAPAATLDALKTDFEARMAQLDDAVKKKAAEQNAAYLAELEKLAAAMKQSADLDGLLAVRDEKARVEAGGELSEVSADAHPKVRALQKNLVAQRAHLEGLKSAALVKRYPPYLDNLKKLQTEEEKVYPSRVY